MNRHWAGLSLCGMQRAQRGAEGAAARFWCMLQNAGLTVPFKTAALRDLKGE